MADKQKKATKFVGISVINQQQLVIIRDNVQP